MQPLKWTNVLALIGLLSTGVHSTDELISVTFYENECYGDVLGAWDNVISSGCATFPDGAHFVSAGDGCGPGKCMVIEYWSYGSCGWVEGGTRVTVGTGCYNINVGFEPVAFRADCLVC